MTACFICGKQDDEICHELNCPRTAGQYSSLPTVSEQVPLSTSALIRNRLHQQNKRFFACDNISDVIEEGDMKNLEDELTIKFEDVLDSLVIDHNDPNSEQTPRRLAKMYLYELMKGRFENKPKTTAFPNEGENKYEGLLVVRAEITSLCSHHHQTVKGVAYIGIIPNGYVMGLSKYIRIAQWCARRGTLQEELCNMIAKEIMKATGSQDVGVYIAATHGCVENRGIMAHSSLTQTTVLNGQFKDPDVKLEFFDQIKLQEYKTGSR